MLIVGTSNFLTIQVGVVSPPPPIELLKLVLTTLAVFGGGVGLYYVSKGSKKK